MHIRDRLARLMLAAALTITILGTAAVSWAITPKVAAGAYHTIRLRSDGTLWGSGLNTFGQLGDGSVTSHLSPVQIGPDNNWVAAAAGLDHTLAVKADGSLWAWGSNQSGQLGDGTGKSKKKPVQIGTDNDWTTVAAGGASSFALKADGTLWAWGKNDKGQLGTGDTTDRPVPVKVLNVGTSRYVAVSTGGTHALALQADGTLWAWGSDEFGQIAISPADTATHAIPVQVGIDSDWTALAAGGLHSIAIKGDGSLWAWGDNTSGQLGLGASDGAPHDTPVQIGGDRDWSHIASGDLHNLAAKRDGSLWSWGDNTGGQLGDGAASDKSAPFRIAAPAEVADMVTVAAGAAHSLAIKANGDLYGWGDNGTGQLGSGTAVSSFSPLLVGKEVISWIDTEPGGEFTVARRSDGTLWTWGDNTSGQLGFGNASFTPSLSPGKVGTAANWIAQATGWSHAVALRADGTMWTWGDNSNGQLGDGTTANREMPTQVTNSQPAAAVNDWKAVAAGDFHTLALKGDGTLWAWGNNSSGQLGDGSGSSHQQPVQIVTNNPGNFDSNWVAIAAGGSHSIAIQADGTLWVWGDNGSGQLGDPLLGSGTNTPQQLVNFSPPVGNTGYNSSWVAIAAGLSHSLALQADGTLWAWGNNFSGQLGNGDTTQPNPPNQPVPVQVVNSGAPYTGMAAGDSFSLARRADGSLLAWGNNTSGQLGNGTTDADPLNPVPHATPGIVITGVNEWTVAGAGGSHAVALKAAESLWSWGNNTSGQLGDGTTITRNTTGALVGGHIALSGVIPFNTINIGLTASRNMTISNTGTAPLRITAITLTGADSLLFNKAAGTCGAIPFTVASGQSCTILITFAPALPEGAKSATVTVTSTDPNAPAVQAGLSGTAQLPFTITVTAGANGSITGPATANIGESPAFLIAPNMGYHVVDVVVNGVSKGTVTSVTVPQIAANATITASFAINTYTVVTTTDANGTINGPAAANFGETPSYTINTKSGYHLVDVKVDGASQGPVTAVTLPPVVADVTIAATFAINTYTIAATAGARGTISPAGTTSVDHGTSKTFTFTPAAGYSVVDVIVDGVSQGAMPSYTFNNVTSDNHTVKAVFVPDGDLNRDGKTDIADALRGLQIVVGLINPTAADLLHGDTAPIDNTGIPLPDRQLALDDVLMILRKAVGITSGW